MFEYYKFVLTKGEMYVGKGYMVHVLFKLNAVVINVMNKNKDKVSTYIINSYDKWPARL